jgi:hypothetical protein
MVGWSSFLVGGEDAPVGLRRGRPSPQRREQVAAI